ncbi:MAG: tRNA preQ1(34) S-adenosylmethionine ribosyltransferase-isomerase QueA [Betaproteobacteria bacterium]|nr:MAG: tRNA preQ1(34) S-adenosylmethionine ribosyltransferase-isomerase QueA [Betaproteobacteria bacterium]
MADRVYRLSDFDFELPSELIAQRPAPARSASRLLRVAGSALEDLDFVALPDLFAAGDVLVMNDTRVIRSRLLGRKPSGGRVELLLERILSVDEAWMQLRASHPPRVGGRIELSHAIATVLERDGRFFRLRFDAGMSLTDYLERFGEVPLPPYISRRADSNDADRYQTIYAREPGAVAAPTAGLHFDQPLLDRIRERGVAVCYLTLHVGAGTFLPVENEELSQHRMHNERFVIPESTAQAIETARAANRSIIAVGTTALRALESAAREDGAVTALAGETDLFITPGYRFRVVDRLLTNFHLPRSTLLMLVSAFAGYDAIRAAYAHAIRERYRFFSYGDAMLLEHQADA